jgi:hypothetical protein
MQVKRQSNKPPYSVYVKDYPPGKIPDDAWQFQHVHFRRTCSVSKFDSESVENLNRKKRKRPHLVLVPLQRHGHPPLNPSPCTTCSICRPCQASQITYKLRLRIQKRQMKKTPTLSLYLSNGTGTPHLRSRMTQRDFRPSSFAEESSIIEIHRLRQAEKGKP